MILEYSYRISVWNSPHQDWISLRITTKLLLPQTEPSTLLHPRVKMSSVRRQKLMKFDKLSKVYSRTATSSFPFLSYPGKITAHFANSRDENSSLSIDNFNYPQQ